MKNKNMRNMKTLAVIALILSAIGTSIAFATLSQNLIVNGAGKISGSTWNVKFTSATGTSTGSGQAGVINGIGTNTLTFSTIRTKIPGDTITFVFTATNSGTIAAKLSSVPIISGILNTPADGMSAILTYDETDSVTPGSSIMANDPIEAGQSRIFKLVIRYDGDVEVTPEEDTIFNLGLTLPYVQK